MRGGHLFWRADSNEVYAVFDRHPQRGDLFGGQWQSDAGWDWGAAGEPDPEGIGLTPPPGRFEPKRGFGWVWRTFLGRENGPLGWGLDREYGFENVAIIQYFERGFMFKGSAPKVYLMFYDGQFMAQE